MIHHVLRRMGFGASAEDLAAYADVSPLDLVRELLAFHRIPDAVDAQIGKPGYAGVTTRGGPFSPNTAIADARQRELFRMIHSRRPLVEKMALFWHNHFATAYSKVAGAVGQVHGARMMGARPEETPGGVTGQYELFRRMGTGSFTDLLVAVAKDPAMLVWLDGRQNTRNRPQENFGRELMELFTTGIGHYTEDDVRAAARAFTGWNLQLVGDRSDPEASYYRFVFNQNQHDTAAKTFTFAIYADGGRTMAGRSGEAGIQDGLDLIAALARHPATARRLAGRLYAYFINEIDPPDDAVVDDLAQTYLASGTSIRSVLQRLFTSPAFLDPANEFARYAWPVEFVVRAVRETGWTGFGVDTATTPLVNMGQQLFEPPDVNGWALGPAWFSTASMLARMNFASALMQNQKFNIGAAAVPYRQSPDRVLDYLLNRFTYAPISQEVYDALLEYLQAGGWTGATSQLNDKAAGAARLIVASSEYQFN